VVLGVSVFSRKNCEKNYFVSKGILLMYRATHKQGRNLQMADEDEYEKDPDEE